MLAYSDPLAAQPLWEQNKGQCDLIFKNYEQAEVADLKYCVGIWEAYRSVDKLSDAEKSLVAKGMERLFHEGDEEAEFLSRNALARLGFAAPLKKEKKSQDSAPKKKRKKYKPGEATEKEAAKAKKIRETGFKLYKKGDCDGALKMYEEALSLYPGFVQALYDSACCYSLTGQKELAIEYLQRLVDIGTKESHAKFALARTDKDFDPMRDDVEFKKTTGYCKIKLLNGVAEDFADVGDEEVEQLEKYLKKLHYAVDAVDRDKHVRDKPHIWYKSHSKNQAYLFSKVINTKSVFVPIDWDSEYDIIISWADKPQKDADGEIVLKNSTAAKGGVKKQDKDFEKRMDNLLLEEENALKQPEEYSRKVDNVVGTPDRVEMKVDSGIRKIESTGGKIEGTVDKIDKLFK
ncbi:MAG: tetratricopeptide repeat protein [Deltaproteobacteria bacterium]|nr:tetratricopeptide repeat protein [Deltaproteobacteria bacterium]